MHKGLYAHQLNALNLLLRGLRQQAGLTQQQLARRLGKPQSFVAKYEAGNRRLDVIELLIIAEALRANPVGLIKALMSAAKLKA